MDAKDLRTQPALSDRNNDRTKYAQSGGIALQCDRNKAYQDNGSNSLAKVEVQNARPCAVIGPDRIVPQPATEAYMKKGPPEPWPGTDNTYRRPPEYPRKLTNYSNPTRNISPRQTYQENMQRIMVPATYNSVKINDDTNNYAQIPDGNIPQSKNIKLNVPSEAKYCDVPYPVNPNSNEQKSVRNSDMCVSSVNPSLSRTVPHGWPPGSVNLRPVRPYGAPELYQYQEYPSCAGPRPIVPRTHRIHHEDPAYVYTEPYYSDGNIRFKPYPTVKDRYPPARYDYIGNYTNPFHPPPSYPHKYDLQKPIPPHPFPPYASVKYLDNRGPEPIIDGYQRNQQGNYNMPYPSQVIHPNYGTVIGNCSQNKMHPFPPDSSIKNIAPNKLPYDNNNKTYVEYDNSRQKIYPQSDSYFVSEMGRLHPMKSQVLMPNYPNINMHTGPPNAYYKKDSAQIKNYEYMAQFRNLDPAMNIHNPMMRHLPMFSPNTLAISPTDSSVSNDTNQNLGAAQEDCGYVSQSSTASVRSMESGINRVPNDYYRRYYDSRYGHLIRTSPMMAKTELHTNSNTTKDKKNIDVRQFLQMWNEGDEETDNTNPKEPITKIASSKDKKLSKTHEVANDNHEQLYVLGLVNVPSEELSKYEHLQTVSKLPENIKGYNNIELLNQFEEVIESTNLGNYKAQASKDNFQMPIKGVTLKQFTGILPRSVSPLDVEAKISQSIIHKEVGCNFEIKPCSPKMLNVDVAAPVQNILAERVIEKVANPVSKSPMLNSIQDNIDYNLMKRPDPRLNMNDNLRNASCKMINTQYSNMNPIDTMKGTYSFQDLESNSGLCLASLPRLDNDIELNFPEVNQQFINANRREAAVSTSPLKDLPTLEMLDQSVNEVKPKDSNKPVLELENKVCQSFSNADPEKEFSKLSKYRKNKTNISEDYERKPLVTKEEQLQNNQNAIRTDSVIIKNPENIKKIEHSEFPSNSLNEPQQTPMNLTSQINCDFVDKSKLEGDFESTFYTKDDDNQSLDVAIDFSLNRNHLINDFKSDTEIKIERDNPIHEVEENTHHNKTFNGGLCEDLTSNNKHYDHKPIEDNGYKSDNCNSNTDVNVGSPIQNIEDKLTTDLNQDSNIGHNVSDSNLKQFDEENIGKATPDDYRNLQRILSSENHVVEPVEPLEPLPILDDNGGDCKMKDDYNDNAPENQFSQETENLIKMNEDTCEFQNEGDIEINKELEMICDNNHSQNEIEATIIKEIHEEIKTNSTDLNDDKNCSVLVLSPQNVDICQTNTVHEEYNNNIEKTVPVTTDNIEIPNFQHSVLKEDVANNQVNTASSNDVINICDDNSSSNLTKDLETKEIECSNSKERCVPVTENEDCNNASLIFSEEKISNNIRQYWSKKFFSPWIQNLTFSEGIVNARGNLEILSDIITNKAHVENISYDNQRIDNIVEMKDLESINEKDNIDIVTKGDSICSKVTNTVDDSVDDLENQTHKKNEEIDTTTENNVLNYIVKDAILNDINEIQTTTLSSSREQSVENVKKTSVISESNDSECDDINVTLVKDKISLKEDYLADEDKSIMSENSSVNNNVCDDIKNEIKIKGILEPSHSNEINNSIQKEEIGELSESDNIMKEASAEDEEKCCNKTRYDGIETLFKRSRPLKRSLSDSALHVHNLNKHQENADEDIQLVLPIKRKKINNLESVDLCSIIQNNRRNSISAFYNEDDVSFCILIDDSCIITEEEEGEEQKICYTEFSEDCLEIQNDATNAKDEESIETVAPIISSPQVDVQCEDSFTSGCEEKSAKALENSWMEDIACVETVICDDIAEDIVISGPPSPKDGYFSENDESGVFSSSEHTDQVKYLYGDKMCSDDAQYLETLYKTPQMDVYKALNSRETQAISECVKYYDKDSLEKVLSESNGNEPYSPEFMNSIMPIGVSNCNTPDDKENIMDIFSSPQSNLNCEDIVENIELNHEQENLLPESMFSQSRDDTVHSCESSIDNVFAEHESKDDTNFMISSSPEVSSTTSEEKSSGILLKITNYKGSRISQINGISSVNNRPSCKFTEEKDYLHSHSNFTKKRPLLTKAAQKYIPPLKESIRDLKVKLTLPQHSLIKLKQLKKTKDDVPKPIKQTNNTTLRIPKKPKPKFEDVLMSIDEIHIQKHKEKTKKAKKSIPKVVIKKTENGSHYASTSNKEEFNPDLTGRKWQPWVFLEKNIFIDKMAIRNKTKAIYSHRKKTYVLAEHFKKYKSVNSAKFVISQPKTDSSSTGLKYTIRLKHSY